MPLSFSQLSSYRRCPRLYEYATVKKLPRQISAGESFGSSAHNTLKKWGELEMGLWRRASGMPAGKASTGQLQLFAGAKEDTTPNALTLETLIELWHQSFIFEGYASRVEADAARKRGDGLMSQFFAWWKEEERHVVGIEKSFKIRVGDSDDSIVISGRFDRVERNDRGLTVIDYKTSAPRSQDQVDADLQLSIYAMAVEEVFAEPCAELILLFLDEENVTIRTTQRSPGQLSDAEKQIGMIAQRIENREFHPTPSKGVCGRCPYNGICDASAV